MLVKLKLDSNNLVTAIAWANPNQRKAGDVTEDGFIIYEVDDTEYQVCVANHTKLIDGHLVVDADYTPPVETPAELEPTAEQLSITAIAQQSSDNEQHIKSVEEAITALAQANGGN